MVADGPRGRSALAPSRRTLARRRLGYRFAGRVAVAVLRRWRAAVHHAAAPAARSPGGRRPVAEVRTAAQRTGYRAPGRPDILRRVLHGVHRRRDRSLGARPVRGQPRGPQLRRGGAAPVDEPEAADHVHTEGLAGRQWWLAQLRSVGDGRHVGGQQQGAVAERCAVQAARQAVPAGGLGVRWYGAVINAVRAPPATDR